MPRTSLLAAIAVSSALLAIGFVTDATWLLGLGTLAFGLTCLVFARDLSEHKPVGSSHDLLPEPKTPAGRQTMMTVLGVIVAVAGAFLLIAPLV